MNDSNVNQSASVIADRQPLVIRIPAHIISVMFHPLFVPIYVGAFLLFIHPLLFAGYDMMAKVKLLATLFLNLTFFPVVTVLLCLGLKFISSLQMDTQKDRIIPLAAIMIFYFWCWFVLRNFHEIPPLFRQFVFGSFLTVIGAWIANIYFKVSLHGLAMGGICFFMFLVLYVTDGGSAQYLAATILIAGLVCTSRLLLRAHLPFELYAGILIGAFCQAAAWWF
jgi:hypothetical protein